MDFGDFDGVVGVVGMWVVVNDEEFWWVGGMNVGEDLCGEVGLVENEEGDGCLY